MDDELELDADLAKFEAMANGTWEPEPVEEEDVSDEEEIEETESEVGEEEEDSIEEDSIEEEVTLEDESDEPEVEDGDVETPESIEESTVEPEVDVIDYKAFYDTINGGDYSYNGKKVNAPDSPEKIIEAINTARSSSVKADSDKKYAPYIVAMKENGLFEDPSKFKLALDLVNGDPEAIKKHLKDLDIDPLAIDLDEVKYEPKTVLKTQVSLDLDDTLQKAEANGYGEKFNGLVSTILDDDVSFDRFSKSPAVRADLHKHMQNGTYDKIMDEMNKISADNVEFRSQPFLARYEKAWGSLPKENVAVIEPEVAPLAPTPQVDEATLREQIRKELKEEQASASRKKASSVSKKRATSAPKSKAFSPMDLEGADLDAHMEFLISGGRS
jgi:hypothetical protein